MKKMESIFQIFKNLKRQPSDNANGYNISSLPSFKNHKIGISHVGQPMFFIKCHEDSKLKPIDSDLEFISVQFNRQCQLQDKKNIIEEGIYTIISLKTDSGDLQEYFLEVVYLVIKNLSEKPQVKELKIEVEKLVNLFSKFSRPSIKTIQGLWAEMLVIEQSKTPDYLIQAWHNLVMDTFDFNDGTDKVEVKSTAKSRRIHNFSVDQLNPNTNSSLIIVSVLTIETGIGKSIFDLLKSIETRLNDNKSVFRLNEVVIQTLGKDFEKGFEVFYDYPLAVDSIKYYDSKVVPSINPNIIPKQVINVRFECDLTDIPNITNPKNKSILHKSLFHK